MKPTLHWVCHSPSPYNDFLFRALARSSEFDLLVHYLHAEWPEYMWSATRSGYTSRSFHRRPLDWTLLRTVLGDHRSVFLTACWQDPSCQGILAALMVLRRPYLVWCDTPNSGHRNWVKEALRSTFLQAVFQRATAVLGTGIPALRAFAKMGAPEESLRNFPYCVDLEQFVPHRKSETPDVVVLGTCCRLQEIKGLDVALRALARLCGRDRRKIRYRIAGSGAEENTLRALVQTLGLTDSVEFCGWLQPEDLPSFYHSLDAYLHPARFEPYGVAVVEALACGLPVLASDQTMAAVDRVSVGESGFLFKADDETDLQRILEIFLNSESRDWARMGQCARRAALSWTPEQALDTVNHLVRKMSNGSRQGAAGAIERSA